MCSRGSAAALEKAGTLMDTTTLAMVFAGALVALLGGLDRMPVGQFMICRPLVCAPLAGWVVGQIEAGLTVGILTELLWLGRLPVGATVPPDDTQASVGAVVLSALLAGGEQAGPTLTLYCLLLALPLAKIGWLLEHWARRRNDSLPAMLASRLEAGDDAAIERIHLRGLGHFVLACLGTYAAVVVFGWLAGRVLEPLVLAGVDQIRFPVALSLPLVGVCVLLASMNVGRSLTLFGASFLAVFLARLVL